MKFAILATTITAVACAYGLISPTHSVDSFATNPTVTPTPLPEDAGIADLNFHKDWHAKYAVTKTEITKKSKAWKDKNLSNYDFTIARYAGGQTNSWNRWPVRIDVRNGVAISRELVDTTDTSDNVRTDGFEEFDTIPKLFDYLLAELEGGNILEVEFDRNLGYPKRAFIIFTYTRNHNQRSIVISSLDMTQGRK